MPLSDVLAGWTAEPVVVGLSGATVERWTRPGEPDRFAKSAPPTWDRGLDAEAERLRWLATTPMAGRVATVLFHGTTDDGVEHLLTTAVPGADGVTLAEAAVATGRARPRHDLARRFGRALRALHDGLDPRACPFDGRLDVRLAAAERRVADGGVDVDDFEPEQAGRTPSDVLDELRRTRPADEDLVVGHGDWCYPNVLFGGPEHDEWGMVDLAGLGVACRWNDLGIGVRTTRGNLGDDAVAPFLEGYGTEPDEDRIRYYILLDELQ